MASEVLSHEERGRLGGTATAVKVRRKLARRDAKIAAAKGSLRAVGARFGVSHEIVRRIRDRFKGEAAA